MSVFRRFAWMLAWLIVLSVAERASAQLDGLAGDAEKPKPPYTVSAQFTQANDKEPARLLVLVDLDEGWHTYSITQPPGGPIRTTITLDKSEQFKTTGDFAAFPDPEKKKEEAFQGLLVESHHDSVVWYAPIELAAGVDPATLSIAGKLKLQACDAKNCLPPTSVPFTAKLGPGLPLTKSGVKVGATNSDRSQLDAVMAAGSDFGKLPPREPTTPPLKDGEFRSRMVHATIEGRIEPKSVAPGGTARLVLTATPDAGYHVYSQAARDPREGNKPTLILLEEKSGFTASEPVASEPPHDGQYDKPVSWTVSLAIPADAKPGEYPIAGLIGYQTCRETQCDFPTAASFTGKITVAPATAEGSTTLAFAPAKYGDVASAMPAVSTPATTATAAAPAPPITESASTPASLPVMLLTSLAGGLILNLMPCVLPVIGLKILSFVQQSGHSRTQVLMLNLWYSAGIMVVFLALATLAVTLNLSWGEQFQSPTFNIVMAGLVFVMALSFLGVWEIPIPGFVGTGKANELASHEGAIGAFAKGVLSTVLATPCSGPMLGAVFGFTLKQPPHITYAIFGTIGLGMASPYLLIGAFPRLIRFLPKPGAWMDTFKQVMGFVLLGTIAILMKFFIKDDYVVSTFGLLIGLWAGCWFIGRTPLYESLGKRLKAWTVGTTIAAVAGGLAFYTLLPREAILDWKPFSKPTLAQYTSQGRTVIVDFTADWCLTCQLNYRNAIDTENVRKLVVENNVVPLLADWTDESEEIKKALNSLGSNSIPLLAIFPAGRAGDPIILRDVITEGQVLEALKQAGPSNAGGASMASLSP